MRLFCLALIALVVCGCGGSSASISSTFPYAGTWNGTWVNVNDATDAGTSVWRVDQNGIVDGHDFDPGRLTTFHVVGAISATGTLTSNSTPTGGTPATLNGPFTITAPNQFSGILAWGVTPVLSYTYTFTKS